MEILLLRHGQTPGNALGKYIGITDEPLSEAGKAALRPYPGRVTAPFVYVTPLQRTAQTAALLFPGLPQRVLPGLAEMNFGIFENRSWRDMEHDEVYRSWVDGGCLGPIPGGEQMGPFTARCAACFEPVAAEALAQGRDQLIFVVHGGTCMALMSLYAQPSRPYFDFMPQNGCGWRLHLDEAAWAETKALTVTEALGGEAKA